MASLFEKLTQGQPPPAEATPPPEIIRLGPAAAAVVPFTGRKDSQVEKTLDWLINHWNKPTITLREICRLGPSPRNWESAARTAKTLVERGWLVRIETPRRDMRHWQIMRAA
jgi:hypothetical protein